LALELLAWKPERLVRRVLHSGKIWRRQEMRTVFANKPDESLKSIFRSLDAANFGIHRANVRPRWKNTCSALSPNRMEDLRRSSLILLQRSDTTRTGQSGEAMLPALGKLFTHREAFSFRRKTLDLTLAWPEHDEQRLGDLVVRLQNIPPRIRKKYGAHRAWNAKRTYGDG